MKILCALSMLVPLSVFAYPERTVDVRGAGEVKIKPDLAYIQLQVTSKGKDAKSAQEKNAKEMARVEKVLRDEFKLEDRDLQTSGFYLNPDYRYEQHSGKQIFVGFSASHGLSVRLRKIERTGDVLDRVSGKGADDLSVTLNGVSFDTDKRKTYEVQTLESAMANAKEKAEALARFSGRKLKGVLRVSDSSLSERPAPMIGLARVAKGGAAMMEADSVSTSVQAGEMVITSNVHVEYELE